MRTHAPAFLNTMPTVNNQSLMARMVDFIKQVVKRAMKDDCMGLANQMAFRLMLTIIPTVVFLISMFGLLGRQDDIMPTINDAIHHLAPAHSRALLQDLINGVIKSKSSGFSAVGIAIALWSSAGGAAVVIQGLFRAFEVEPAKKPFWYYPVMGMSVMVCLCMTFFVASNIIIFGQGWIEFADKLLNLSDQQVVVLTGLRWAIALGAVTFFTSIIYVYTLREKVRHFHWKPALQGALSFTVLWLVISLGFEFYVSRFYGYNPVYGALGGIVVLMMWLYLTCAAILIGGEMTSVFAGVQSADKSATP